MNELVFLPNSSLRCFQQLSPIEQDLEKLRSCLESVRCEISIETKDISIKDLINAQNIFSYLRPSTNYSILSPYRIIPMENYKRFISSKDHQTILWLDNRKQLNWIDSKYQNHLLTRKSNKKKKKKNIDFILFSSSPTDQSESRRCNNIESFANESKCNERFRHCRFQMVFRSSNIFHSFSTTSFLIRSQNFDISTNSSSST